MPHDLFTAPAWPGRRPVGLLCTTILVSALIRPPLLAAQPSPTMTHSQVLAMLRAGVATERILELLAQRCVSTAPPRDWERTARAAGAAASVLSAVDRRSCAEPATLGGILFYGLMRGDSANPHWGGRIYMTRFDRSALARVGIVVDVRRERGDSSRPAYAGSCSMSGPLTGRWDFAATPEPAWTSWKSEVATWGWNEAGNFTPGTYTVECALAGQTLRQEFRVDQPAAVRAAVTPGLFMTGLTFYGEPPASDPDFRPLPLLRKGYGSAFTRSHARFLGVAVVFVRTSSAPPFVSVTCIRDFRLTTRPKYVDTLSHLIDLSQVTGAGIIAPVGVRGWDTAGDWPAGPVEVTCRAGSAVLTRTFYVEDPA